MAPKIIILGAGLSGITMAIELRKRLGLESFTVSPSFSTASSIWKLTFL